MIGNNSNLTKLLAGFSIGIWKTSMRTQINIMMAVVGVFIFSLYIVMPIAPSSLITAAFMGFVLGSEIPSMVILYSYFMGTAGAILGFVLGVADFILGIFGFRYPLLIIPSHVIYIGSWIYFTLVLNKYEDLSRKRIETIEKKQSLETDELLEKGILQSFILQQHGRAYGTLQTSLFMPGGNALNWYLGGVALGRMSKYKEALQAFDRADQALPDKNLKKKIELNSDFARKKLK